MFFVIPVSGCNHGEGVKLDEISWTHGHSSRVSRDPSTFEGIGLLFEGTALQSILEFLMILLLTEKDVL